MRWGNPLWLAAAFTAVAACQSSSAPAPELTAAPVTSTAAPSVVVTTPPEPPKPPPEPWLHKTLRTSSPEWEAWLKQAETLKLQVLVTVLEPNGAVTHSFRVDEEYFYPASAIKLPLAVVALETLNEQLGFEVHARTRLMRCRYDRSGCEPPPEDEDHERDKDADGVYKHKKLRVGSEIRKMLSYSDNDSYNRLWDIVGHQRANEKGLALGLSSVRFHHRMNAPADKSINTQRVTLLPPGKKPVVIKKRKSTYELAPTKAAHLAIGKGYNAGGKIVDEPLQFGTKNFISLTELQRVLLSVVKPEHPSALKLSLSEEQRELLIKAMTARLISKKRDAEHHPFTPGVLETLDKKQVRYVSKSGRAYGFHLENAYIENKSNGRSMFVTAVVYANPNEILNDDDYAYDDTSKPLLADLGRVLTKALLVAP